MSAPRSAPLQQHAGCRITKQTLLTTRLERNRRSLTFFFPYRPRNANKLLIPCNLLGFPLNPHFNPASPCRRSYQHVTSSHTMQHRANVIVSPRWRGSMPSGRAICPGNPRVLLSQGSPLQTRQAPRDSEHPPEVGPAQRQRLSSCPGLVALSSPWHRTLGWGPRSSLGSLHARPARPSTVSCSLTVSSALLRSLAAFSKPGLPTKHTVKFERVSSPDCSISLGLHALCFIVHSPAAASKSSDQLADASGAQLRVPFVLFVTPSREI